MQLPYFWRVWMYRLTPFTCKSAPIRVSTLAEPFRADLIEGLCANAMSGIKITCTPDQFTFLTPPSGQSCLDYLEPYTSSTVGYAQEVAGKCGYCAVSLLCWWLWATFSS